MEEEIVSIDSLNGKVKALGLEVNIHPDKLKVLINGIDSLKNVKIESLKIIKVE